MGKLKIVDFDLPSGIAIAFQAEIDRGWDGIVDFEGKPYLVMAIEYDPESGIGTVRVSPARVVAPEGYAGACGTRGTEESVIPPRLRQILVRLAISDYMIGRGPKKGQRQVMMGNGCVQTANYRATDLRTLERKGLITYERCETLSALWGVAWFEVMVTEAGKEEISDEFARRCAEADAANAKLEVKPDPFGEGFTEDVDEERDEVTTRSEARARQRATKA